MGNAHSTTSTHRNTVPLPSESNELAAASSSCPQDVTDTSVDARTPTKNKEGAVAPPTIQRRRSLMKFPSLRRRPRSIIGLGDQSADSQVLSTASPSRRRWRAFSGLKGRPVSAIAASGSPSTEMQPLQDAPRYTSASPASNAKGKQREQDAEETVQADESDMPLGIEANEPGPFSIEYKEPGPSPDAMLQELRNMQDVLSSKDELQSEVAVDPKAESGSISSQVERPPTPIPTSVMDPTPEPSESDVLDSTSHAALSEALGAWMSGRSRAASAALASSDAPVALSTRPAGTRSSSMYTNRNTGRYNESDLLNSLARSSSQAVSAPGSPSASTVPPALPVSSTSSRDGQQATTPFDRRTLPPAGTGTLVVVQGVVHTTDVRHTHSRTPSNSQPVAESSTRPPSSVSPTPTIQPPTPGTSSHSGSGASTPQPSSTPRRSRFSSLTSGLRHRPRPRTPTSPRHAVLSGWRHGVMDATINSGTQDETTLERNVGRLATERGASDSETASTSRSTDSSPMGVFLSTDETSTLDSHTHDDRFSTEDSATLRDDSQVRNSTEALASSDHVDDLSVADGRERDGFSDEESEAELSASSIEVLGTLLSVATAATAASLVTGTTDPLFSSGLAGPLSDSRTASPYPQTGSIATPASPSSRSGGSSAPSGGVDNGEAAVNTRMRAAWESLRDRFSRSRGRRGGNVGDDEPGEMREDPREQMLREMARAFNMGLGLDAETPSEPTAGQMGGSTSEPLPGGGDTRPDLSSPFPVPLPADSAQALPGTGDPGPEGSFERFLHNLQVDLRTALTEDYAARRARAQARHARAAVPSSDETTIPRPPLNTETLTPSVDSEESQNHEDLVPPPNTGTDPHPPNIAPPVPNTPRTANLDLPPPGDTYTQYGDGSGSPPQAQGITGQPGAGINWWRLYRFPPMQLAPHPSATDADQAAATDVSAPPPATSAASPTSMTEASTETPRLTNDNLPLGSDAAPMQNVVPVIVVGLQSVPVNRGGPLQPLHHDPATPLGTRSIGETYPGTNAPTDAYDRDRAWPLRAASRAFGRMGRRADADGNIAAPATGTTENTASAMTRTGRQSGRTYLIFVIGGYYPPNHSIVTGADDMNSFEALWELAELLGQVKPPVASKEDIEKSGLEIIKASSLPEYEKSGRVASNTVERCLICLDDYESQDELRLLSCRHIFHMLCVDKWLEQGKNNCPACRSKGVRTGDDDPLVPTPPVAGPPPEPSS